MTASERLRALFDEMLEIPAEDWSHWLDARVPDTATREQLQALLLADHSAGQLLDTPVVRYAELLIEDDEADRDEDREAAAQAMLGRRFGAFRLVRLLGHGGMGTVFLGEREDADFRQHAAVKLLHKGVRTEVEQRLFRRERRILARLEHPDIARLIDGGVSADGLPFLVMEYIDGLPITRYAEEHALGVAARLALLVRLARAVDAAHRALVVHRDLKPGNVLVGRDGTLKVLDFGIASLSEDEDEDETAGAAEGDRVTPGYAAPEQLGAGIITALADVHALGVLMHELLTGRAPTLARVRVDAGARASLAPELLQIVAKATAAEPRQRYASAAAFADDLERYLDRRPVLAHPASRWYRTRKFVARHRGAVVVTGALLLGLVASLGLAVWQAEHARQQAQAATREAHRANSVRNFVEQLFEPVRQGVAEGRMPAITDLVAAGQQRLQADRELGTAERVDLLLLFSRLRGSLGEREQARELADNADALAASSLDRLHPMAIAALLRRASLDIGRGELDRGEQMLVEAEARLDQAGAGGPPLIDLLDQRSTIAMDRGERDQALDLTRRALAVRIDHYGADAAATAAGWNNLGYGLVGTGRHGEAVDAYARAWSIDQHFRDPDSYDVLNTQSNWGWALALSGQLVEAGERLARVDAGLARVAGRPRGLHVINLQKLCIVQAQLAQAAAADSCARMLELSAATAGEDSGTFGDALSFEALRRIGAGDLDGASEHLDRAWQRFPEEAANARSRARIQRLRAEIAWLRGDAAAARRQALQARPQFERQRDQPAGLLVLDALLLLACDAAPAPDCPAGLAADLQGRLQAAMAAHSPALALAQLILARHLLERGESVAALALLEPATASAAASIGAGHPWTRALRVLQGLAADDPCDADGAGGDRPVHASREPWLAQVLAQSAQAPACRPAEGGAPVRR